MTNSVEFSFEELSPRDERGRPILGIMLYGTATLVTDDYDFDKYSFVVSSIEIDGYGVLPKVDGGLYSSLFEAIRAEIYNDKTEIGKDAQIAFRDAVDGDVDTMPSFRERVYNSLQNPAIFRERTGFDAATGRVA